MKALASLSFRPRTQAALVGVAVLFTAAVPASAQLIAYEGFDYVAGADNLAGQAGGSGFAAAWGTSPGTEAVLAGGLGYTDALGNQLITAGGSGYFAGGATSNAASISRTLSASRADGTTTWISFVGQRLGTDMYWAASVQFRSGDTGGTTEKMAIGELSENNATAGAPAELAKNLWGLYNQANPVVGAVESNTADGYLFGNLSLILVRVDNLAGATDEVRMWVNPNLNIAPSDASASVTLTGLNLDFDRVRIFSRQGDATHANAQLAIDELRLGGTFADVTPFLAIPEPSTYAAILGGLTLGVAAFRRFRRERRG